MTVRGQSGTSRWPAQLHPLRVWQMDHHLGMPLHRGLKTFRRSKRSGSRAEGVRVEIRVHEMGFAVDGSALGGQSDPVSLSVVDCPPTLAFGS